MPHLGTSTSLAIALFVCCFNFTSAWYGKVTLYSDAEFEGPKYPWGVTKTQRCYDLSCFDNRASSVKWEGLPKKGTYDSKSRIAFYTGKNCTGESRDWPTDGYINGIKGNYPMNFKWDGINDQVSSFMIWENSKEIKHGTLTPCPWGTSKVYLLP